MGERFLIDTSAIIKYLNQSLVSSALVYIDNVVEQECNISVITRIELLAWQSADENYLKVVQELISKSIILNLNEAIIKSTIEIRKICRIKLPDAVIAATSLVNGFTLIADNDNDFNKVSTVDKGFKYINPRLL